MAGGFFARADAAADAHNKQNRLNMILQSWQRYPGRAPNGTGSTGLMSTDSQGYSKMLNEQTEALNLENELGGKGPVNVKVGRSGAGVPGNLADSPAWWLSGDGPNAPTIDSLPLSMRSLFQRGR